MHHDDSIHTVSLAGRRLLVVRCDERGGADRAALAAAWAADAAFVWLSTDGSLPEADVVREAPDDVVTATLLPVVDAVKAVDDGTIVETVDRSTLSTVSPPALLPRPVVDAVLAGAGGDALLAEAVARWPVVALRTGG